MSKLLLMALLALSGCAYFIAKIDTPLVDTPPQREARLTVPTFCPAPAHPQFQLVGTMKEGQTAYLDLIKRLGGGFDHLDHFALWSLVQMSMRPDQSSPTSRFQVLIHDKGQTAYYDFFSEVQDGQYPFLHGIEWVLKKHGKKKSLEHYAQLLSEGLNRRLQVGKELAEFLAQNQLALKGDKELAPYYFRGNEVLKEGETFPEIDYKGLVRLFRKSSGNQKVVVNTSLTPFVTQKGHRGSCNYDFNLYDNSIFLIDRVIPVANLFGYAGSGAAFMASTSQKLASMKSLEKTQLFKGESKVRSSAVCVIEGEDKRLWTMANQSRDPGQHLFHLVRYGLSHSASAAEVDKLIRHSRHLFLSDPVRLVIESGRSRPDQIESLLKLNLPIYNAERLGNIWAYASFPKESRFIIDDRNPGSFLCQ